MTITAPCCQFDGFSKLAMQFAAHLLDRSEQVSWKPLFKNDRYGNFKVMWPKCLRDIETTVCDADEIVFAHSKLCVNPSTDNSTIVTGIYDGTLPLKCKESLQKYARIVVLSDRQKETLQAFGLSNVHCLFPPVDPVIYKPDGCKKDGTRFGFVAKTGDELGLKMGLDAFFEAFPGVEGPTLSIKVEPGVKLPKTDDPRISYVHGWLQPYQLARWYRSLDMLLSPNRGTYCDWHALQADACDTFSIAANYFAMRKVEACSTRHGLVWKLDEVVDLMRLTFADPNHIYRHYIRSTAKLVYTHSTTPSEFSESLLHLHQCQPIKPSAMPVTLETSSTPCPSCGG